MRDELLCFAGTWQLLGGSLVRLSAGALLCLLRWDVAGSRARSMVGTGGGGSVVYNGRDSYVCPCMNRHVESAAPCI